MLTEKLIPTRIVCPGPPSEALIGWFTLVGEGVLVAYNVQCVLGKHSNESLYMVLPAKVRVGRSSFIGELVEVADFAWKQI